MNLSVTSLSINNTSFNAKRIKYSKEELSAILMPFKDSGMNLKQIMQETNLSRTTIKNWFDENFGKSATKLAIEKKNNKLRDELIKYRKEGLSQEQIAEIYGRNKKWVNKKIYLLGATSSRQDMYALMEENIPWMLEAGYTIDRIHKALEIGYNTVSKWISKNIDGGIKQYRKKQGINIWRNYEGKYPILKKELTEFFQNGGTIVEAKRRFNLTKSRVHYWLKIFNIKTAKQNSKEFLEQNIVRMLDNNMKVGDIAKEAGVSEDTVRRYILRVTGTAYKAGKN